MWAETWKILGTVDTSFCAAAMHFVHLKKMHLVDSTGIQCAGDDYFFFFLVPQFGLVQRLAAVMDTGCGSMTSCIKLLVPF
jgi:hypothetical protein